MTRTCSYFVVALGLLGCGDDGAADSASFRASDARLIGGREIGADTFPAAVMWATPNTWCTGTVIGPRTVLTAAHCIRDNLDGQRIWVTNGARPDWDARFTVDHAAGHPSWPSGEVYGDGSVTPAHDVGVIVMREPLPFPIMRPALYGEPSPVGEQGAISVVGYGCTISYYSRTGTGTRRTADAPFSSYDGLTLSVPASSGGFVGLCPGDSGGPAIIADRVVGIASWVYFESGGVPTVSQFARVDAFSVRTFLESQSPDVAPLPPPEYSGGGL